VLEEMKTILQNFPDVQLQEILTWATINGAKFLHADKLFGSFEKGKIPGAISINDLDLEHLSLTKASKAQRIC
jgi:cytosine/adenosine deaminase-related metal-dependent hydrolase